ncbi:hypothetical protein ACET3Z_027008 [Daucus carota]
MAEVVMVNVNPRGRILCMLSGSLEIQNPRVNEFQALLEGCKCAFVEDWKYIVLESDHQDATWEWNNSTIEGALPEHAELVQQLNQRRADRNFHMEVRLCEQNANALAAYLADYGARNFKVMVIMAQPFGRIFELWNQDMGLGSADQRFVAVHEAELGPAVDNGEDVQDPEVEDVQAVQEMNVMNEAGGMVEVIELDD